MNRFLLSSLVATCTVSAVEKPNLLFILIDDAGYDDFSYTGCKDWPTPNIDSIAKSGTTFSQGYVTASVCGPSRAGLITGRYQQSFGLEENLTGGLAKPVPKEKFGLPLEVPTLGKLLQQKGYVTSAFGKWHLGSADHFHPNKRGFDHFVGFLGGHRSFWPLKRENRDYLLRINEKVVKTPGYLTDYLGKEAENFITANKEKPFFMYLAYNAVHSPLEAKTEDLDSLSKIDRKGRKVLGAMTVALDRSIGGVIKCLKDNGLYENTVIVFSNDNGAATYLDTRNGGFRGRKGTVWEGGLKVPYCISWPKKIAANKVCDTPVNTLDVASTFCELAGFTLDEIKENKLPGANLVKLANGEKPQRSLYWRRGNTSAIRTGDWKLITLQDKPSFLFNLKNDQFEKTNLLGKHDEIQSNLMKDLSTWGSSLPEPMWRKKAATSYHKFLLKYWEQ